MIGGFFHLIFWLIGTLIILGCAAWAFVDGNDRGKPGILVAALVFFTFPLGLILWLLFRPAGPDGRG